MACRIRCENPSMHYIRAAAEWLRALHRYVLFAFFFTASVSAVYPALRSEAVAFDGNFRGCAFLSRIYIFTLYFARMM